MFECHARVTVTSRAIDNFDPFASEMKLFTNWSRLRVGDNVEAMALTAHDLAAIRAAIEMDAAAVRRADWDAITRMFTVDAIRFPPHQPPIRGRAAIRAWLDTFPAFEEFAITADEIVGGDGLAFVRGTYTMTIGGPTPVTDRGNYMGLMRKQPDGSWLWTTDMAVSEMPVPMSCTE